MRGARAAFTALRRQIFDYIRIVTVLGNHKLYRIFHSEELARRRTIAPRRSILGGFTVELS